MSPIGIPRSPLLTGTTTLDQLGTQFSTDGLVRTQLAAALATELRGLGLTSNDVDISTQVDANGTLTEFVVGATSNDPLVQLQVADAAMRVLSDSGVNLAGIATFDASMAPAAWNVVYKDGGWIING